MFFTLVKPPREPLIVIALLICGALVRLVVPSGITAPYRFEIYNVAASLVTTGRFAYPFGCPSGLTAHVGMLTPFPPRWLIGSLAWVPRAPSIS
jgi:hypothetical protein